MTAKRPGHVLYASDDRGYSQLAVAMHSLLSHADSGRELEVSVFTGCGALSEEHRQSLRGLAAKFPFARLDVIDVDLWLEPHRDTFAKSGTHWGMMIWARCLVGEIFAGENRPIVYMDIDTLVCRDLGELYEMDMSDCGDGRPLVLGAVCEEGRASGTEHDQIWSSPLFNPKAMQYFNSGFLVMNVKAFREERLFEKIAEWYAVHKHEVQRPDQDALNCLFWDRTRFLHPRYNHCDGWLERQSRCSPKDELWRGNPPREVLEAILDPAILHFWGSKKPWRWNHRPEGARYEAEMREAGVLEGRLPGATPMRRLVGAAFGLYHRLLRRKVEIKIANLKIEKP